MEKQLEDIVALLEEYRDVVSYNGSVSVYEEDPDNEADCRKALLSAIEAAIKKAAGG